MTSPLRLVIFDVDGTLVDSQSDIVAAMSEAFQRASSPPPTKENILSIVGLSLDRAMEVLAPDVPPGLHDQMVAWYKEAYMGLRAKVGAAESSPLYPGARAALERLNETPDLLLGVATGKSKRGLDKLFEAHALDRFFVTRQVSDFHPSKPHPSMVQACLAETGVAAEHAVVVGDTSFDMDMAKAAGVPGIGVSWGYHPASALKAADQVIDDYNELSHALSTIWGARQ
ncbi:MAG: HAD-IA family hydrolase [Pseudomonadota bacterium]